MSKLVNTLLGAGIAFAAINFAKRWFTDVELGGINLTQPNITPGAWLCYYLGDYLTAHPTETTVHSSPLELHDGSFAWATNTPEWDRAWFEKRGFEFPSQWLPYSDLEGLPIEMRSVGT